MSLPTHLSHFEHSQKSEIDINACINALPVSFIMKEMLRNAIQNSNKNAKNRRYSEKVQDFATYVYMLCGKYCYEVLSSNMPLPQADTVRKFNLYSVLVLK